MVDQLSRVPAPYKALAKQALELAAQKKWGESLTLPSGRSMTVSKICLLLHLDPEGIDEDEEE